MPTDTPTSTYSPELLEDKLQYFGSVALVSRRGIVGSGASYTAVPGGTVKGVAKRTAK
jgi:hypothetical protein